MGFGGDLLQILTRGWTFLFTLLAMSLVGNAIAIQHYGNSSVNYAMFTATFAMLTLLVWVAGKFVGLPAIAVLVLDGLSMLFSIIAGIVLAARLHAHSCSNTSYLITNSLAQGKESRCRELQASCAFFWFMWAGFLVSFLLGLSESGTKTFRGPRKTGSAPAMSQV